MNTSNEATNILSNNAECLAKRWHDDGYIIIRNCFDNDKLQAIIEEIDDLWTNRVKTECPVMIDITTGRLANHRIPLKDCPIHIRKEHHRLNDIYLVSEEFRKNILSGEQADALRKAFGGDLLIVNSLYFNFGSENDTHVDTFVLPPPIENKMAGMTIALEPYTEENGVLFFYPGSHKIPQYKFSNGGIRSIESEKHLYKEYIAAEFKSRDIERKLFLASPGDVIKWHTNMAHGGMPIAHKDLTRSSIVVHFWRAGDLEGSDEYPWLRGLEVPAEGGYYLDRPHQLPMSAGGIL